MISFGPIITDTSLLGLRIPGAYVEIYNIFAINRNKEIVWGFYSNTQQSDGNEHEHSLLTPDKLYSMSCIMDDLMTKRLKTIEITYESEFESDNDEFKVNLIKKF